MNSIIFSLIFFFQENTESVISTPKTSLIEPTIISLVLWLKLIVETTGAIIIAIGVVLAIYQFMKTLATGQRQDYTRIRLLLARYLALALEFQLGADILSTAITPTLDQILTLGAIAIIRTGLNYFLSREMKEERKITEAEKGVVSEANT